MTTSDLILQRMMTLHPKVIDLTLDRMVKLLAALGKPGRPALLAIRIHIERCYFHCARSVLRSRLWQPEHWPETKRISFGKVFAARTGANEDQAAKIDAFVDQGYTSNLWSNG